MKAILQIGIDLIKETDKYIVCTVGLYKEDGFCVKTKEQALKYLEGHTIVMEITTKDDCIYVDCFEVEEAEQLLKDLPAAIREAKNNKITVLKSQQERIQDEIERLKCD